MNEFGGLAIVLLMILAVITLLGHGMWVLLSKLFGGKGPRVTERCPSCGAWLPMGRGGCPSCGWASSRSAEHRRQDALRSVFQQIIALERRGLLDDVTKQLLVESIVTAQTSTVGQAPAAFGSPKAARPPTAIPVAELVTQPPLPIERPGDGDEERSFPEPPELERAGPADVQDRVRRYAKRQQASADKGVESAAGLPPRRPARPWSEVLAAFLEQSNIRWGELIGGLLIVCCSIALVISFWSEIAERPFLKFFVFNGVTAALFGLGFYSYRKWRLETTSQGLLIIATLLVPLNFLAIAALSTRGGEASALTIAGEVFSTVVFTALIYFAGRIALPVAAWPLAGLVVLPSVATLFVGRYVNLETAVYTLQLFAGLPLFVYMAGNGVLLTKYRTVEPLRESEAGYLFKLLGLSTFAVLLPLGLLLANSGRQLILMHELAPLGTLLAFPALATGLLLWRQLDRREGPWLRTAGTSVGVLGACVLAAANVLAWPEPLRMVPVTALTAAIFVITAIAFRIREAHLLVALATGWDALLLALVLVEGVAWQASAEELTAALFSRTTAIALVPLSIVSCLAGAAFLARNRRIEGWCYALVAGGMAAASLILVSWLGWGVVGDTSGAVWVYAIYAVACLAAALFLDRSAAAWLGAVLLLAALAQGLVFTYAERLELSYPWLSALLMHAVVCVLLAVAVRGFSKSGARAGFRRSMQAATCATSLAAAALVVYLTPSAPAQVPAVTWSIIAALWLVVGVSGPWLSAFSIAQLALVLAMIFSIGSALERFEWFLEARYPWLDPWTLAAQGIGLVGLALAWLVFRRVVLDQAPSVEVPSQSGETRAISWRADLRELLARSLPPLDQLLAVGVTVLLLALAVYAAGPGAMQELSPREIAVSPVATASQGASSGEANAAEEGSSPRRVVPPIGAFAIPGIPHHHAASIGSWFLLVSLVVLLLASLRAEYEAWKGITLVVTLLAAPLLLAAYAEGDVAVASALRWLSTGYLLVGSAAIWARRPLMQAVRAAGLAPPLELSRGASGPLRSGVLVLSLVPLMAMLCYVGLAAVLRSPLPAGAGALYGMVGGIAVLLVGGAALIRYARLNAAVAWAGQASMLLVVLGVAPLIAVSLYVVAAAMRQSPILGPEPDSLFAQMGAAASYAVPIVITALVLVGYALRERDSAFAFAGAMVFCVAATAGYLLWSASQALPFDLVQWIRLAQLNAGVCAVYAILWIGLRRWDRRQQELAEPSAEPLLVTLVCVGVVLQLIVLLPAAGGLFLEPVPSLLFGAVGSGPGWGSLLVSCLALVLLSGATRIERVDLRWTSLAVFITGIMLAATASHWDTGNWLSFHVMLVALGASAWCELGMGWLKARALTRVPADAAPSRRVTLIASVLAALTVLTALRSMFGDPQAPWWAAGICFAMSVLNAGLACWSTRRGYVVAAGLLLNLTTSLVWLKYGQQAGWPSLVEINLIVLTLPAPLWMLLDRYQKLARGEARRLPGIPWHRASTWFALSLLALLVARGLAADLQAVSLRFDPWVGWSAWGAVGVGVLTCLWDVEAKSRISALYLFGLVGAALLLDRFDLSPRWLAWTGLMVVAAFGVGTSYLWSVREKLSQVALRLRIAPASSSGDELLWLIPSNAVIAVTVVVLAFWVQLTFAEAELRVAASQAALAQAISLGLLAWGRLRSPLQYASLLTGAIAAVAFGWSWLEPGSTGTVLNRAVVVLAAIAAVAALYGLGFSKLIRRTNEWTVAAERLVPSLVAAAGAVLIFVLGFEVVDYVVTGATTISWPALVTVAIVLVLLCAAALVAALVPGRDPLGLSERGRTAYVYAAEVILALLFLHLRLTMPWLFGGFFRRYWPLVVMLLAFVGVGLAESFRRQRRTVLAKPLEKSGAFLPLLPVLGFWFVPSEAHFSVIMVAAAGIYAVLSIMRKSFVYGVLAAAAANGGLWYLLGQAEGWRLFEHPQIWFIPPALCVLAAAYLNRAHLRETELATIRYASATVIYISSTADIFLVGVAEAPWLPFVLAGLSLAGIFAGILLRVQSFLLLGTGFLILALLTVIWYAAVDLEQTWVWSVSGIIAGVLIIALFAVFEKKRQEVLGMIAQLKEWDQ